MHVKGVAQSFPWKSLSSVRHHLSSVLKCVERADVFLGHDVEYRGAKSRLPILVLERSKGGHLEGARETSNLTFSGGQSG